MLFCSWVVVESRLPCIFACYVLEHRVAMHWTTSRNLIMFYALYHVCHLYDAKAPQTQSANLTLGTVSGHDASIWNTRSAFFVWAPI